MKFQEIEFPVTNLSMVYVILFVQPGKNAVPFYVGETGRGFGRIGDYITASWGAQTDFKVGMAVRMFRNNGCKVVIRYAPHEHRRIAERELLATYRAAGHKLLNDVPNYNYKTAEREVVVGRIRDFVEAACAA